MDSMKGKIARSGEVAPAGSGTYYTLSQADVDNLFRIIDSARADVSGEAVRCELVEMFGEPETASEPVSAPVRPALSGRLIEEEELSPATQAAYEEVEDRIQGDLFVEEIEPGDWIAYPAKVRAIYGTGSFRTYRIVHAWGAGSSVDEAVFAAVTSVQATCAHPVRDLVKAGPDAYFCENCGATIEG